MKTKPLSFIKYSNKMILSIVMPCLNEAETLASCIQKANHFLLQNNLVGEIIVADNGSTDASVAIAQEQGARVVPVAAQGYGAALRGGILAAKGKYVVMGDADDSYDFSNLSSFIDALDAGHDLVMGNRFKGGDSEWRHANFAPLPGQSRLVFHRPSLFQKPSG